MKKKTLLSWSSGKDSAWSLYRLQQDPRIELVGLFSVMNGLHDRVSMHATRRDLLVRQAAAAGLPLRTVSLPDPCSMEQCDEIMGRFVADCAAEGIEAMAFGDLFLEDVRSYREKQLAGTLSGGEQQMLAIGRALMSRPKMLLLDEPSMGLAPIMVQKIFEVIQAVAAAGMTILLVEQNAKLALEVSRRGYVMESGEITFSDESKALLENPRVRQAYLGE